MCNEKIKFGYLVDKIIEQELNLIISLPVITPEFLMMKELPLFIVQGN
jgi:hypothetical protein